jgi:hypothetical protein
MNSSTNTSNSISSMPKLSQAELDKLILTPEAKAHYSQENEIKRLIIERETYKRAYEQQQKNINEVANKIDTIMSQPVKNNLLFFSDWKIKNNFLCFQPVETTKHTYTDDSGMSRTCTHTVSMREYAQQEYFNHQYETLFSKMNFSKMPRFKIVNEIDYIKNFIFYY